MEMLGNNFHDEIFGETTKTYYNYSVMNEETDNTKIEPWMDYIVQTLYYLIDQARQKNKTSVVLEICISQIKNEIDKYSIGTSGHEHLNNLLSNVLYIYEYFVSVSIFIDEKLQNRTSPCGMIFDCAPHFAMLVKCLLPNGWSAKHWQEKKFSDFVKDHSRCRCQNFNNDRMDYYEKTRGMHIYEQMQHDYYMYGNRPSNPNNCWVRPNKKGKNGFAPEVKYKKQFRSSSKVVLIIWRTIEDRQIGDTCRKMPKSLVNGTKSTIKVGQQIFLTAVKECKNKLEIDVDLEQSPKHNQSIFSYIKLAVIDYKHVELNDF